MNQINREDMLELTRRMTLKRNCFDRIAGAYLDRDGFVDGTFNKNFRQLSLPDQQKNLDIAKTIPFSETNVALKEYVFSGEEKKPGSVWRKTMHCLIFFMKCLGKNIRRRGIMRSISFTGIMMFRERQRIRKASGNRRKFTGS